MDRHGGVMKILKPGLKKRETCQLEEFYFIFIFSMGFEIVIYDNSVSHFMGFPRLAFSDFFSWCS